MNYAYLWGLGEESKKLDEIYGIHGEKKIHQQSGD